MTAPNGINGLNATLARIQAIRERFEAPELKSAKASSAELNAFGRILNDKLSPDAMMQSGEPDSEVNADEISSMVDRYASQNGVDPSLAKAVVKAESGFNPKAVSQVGAMGLMQLMPGTAKGLGVSEIHDPEQNIQGGTKYLGQLLQKYHDVPKALAAYNAGPGNVDKYGGVPPFSETQNYVNRVLGYQRQYQAAQ